MYSESVKKLIGEFEKLPGIGHKTAERLAYSILNMNEYDVNLFAKSLIDTKTQIHPCPICGVYTENAVCSICENNDREPSVLLVVATSKDVVSLEKITSKYKYHVLNGEICMARGIGPSKLRIKQLLARIEEENIKELILATNPTIEGETTALYIEKMLEQYNITISRLAYGLPMGAQLDYADELTLTRAFEGRKIVRKE